jgi:phosphodiesterase/alkaline phosphatase D-like protein
MSRTVTRRQALRACGVMLMGAMLLPQIAAAHGLVPSPAVSNVLALPGATNVMISVEVEAAQGATLAMWSNEVQESYQAVSPASDTARRSFTIMGLQPDTRYYYEILLQDPFGAPSIAFAGDVRTLPAPGVQDEG